MRRLADRPAVLLLYDLAHEGHGLGGGRCKTGSTELTQYSAPVGGRLADLGGGCKQLTKAKFGLHS